MSKVLWNFTKIMILDTKVDQLKLIIKNKKEVLSYDDMLLQGD